MALHKEHIIQVFEWGRLKVGQSYEGVTFDLKHLDALAQYAEQSEDAAYYKTYYREVRFNQYVGVIKIGQLTIEVLPKVDKGSSDKKLWQDVLLQMLLISMQVEAKTTTPAAIDIKSHNILEAYLHLFLVEAERLIHQGLVKKYRTTQSNQNALKGKLLVHKQVIKNATHAERFYVEHSVYDRNNTYNFILKAALKVIVSIGNDQFRQQASALLLFFPDCKELPINEKLFELTYDRKTEDYKRAIQLSRIILLNFHPNLKTGEDDLLAIMFDMNYLWEKYIYWSLKRAIRNRQALTVIDQQSLNFWQAEKGSRLRLKPDIVLTNHETKQKWVIDTKWKYESRTSIEDIRQLYAYGKYFGSKDNYLLYPATLTGDKVKRTTGQYFHPLETGNDQMSDERCGLIFTDLIDGHKLHDGIGELIIAQLLEQEAYSNA